MYSEINNIEFDLTGKCNLDCSYCYLEGRNEDNFMRPEIVDLFLDRFFKNKRLEDVIHVSFWGGEPLLNFEMIKYIVSAFSKYSSQYNTVNYQIITNGTLFNSSIAEYCRDNKISVQITVDGIKEQHDKCRVYRRGGGTYETIMQNVELLKRIGVKYFLRSTITSDSKKPSVIVDYYKNIGIENVSFGIVTPTMVYSDSSFSTSFSESIALDLVNLFSRDFETENFRYTRIESIISFLCGNKPSNTCGVGKNKIAVRYDGLVFPCHRYVNTPSLSIGDVFSEIELDKHYPNTHSTVENSKKCKECEIKHFCGGTCYYEIQNRKDLDYVNEYECVYRNELIRGIIGIVGGLKLNNTELYNSLIKRYSKDSLMIGKKNQAKDICVSDIFVHKKKTKVINLELEGLIYSETHFGQKYIANSTSMVIWDMIDGCRTVKEIAQEIATVCEIPIAEIEADIYQQLAKFQELGFIEEVK